MSAAMAPHAGAPAPSLRRRLSRFVLLLALTWVVVASVLLALWLRHEVHELLDDSLTATTEALAVVLHQSAPGRDYAALGDRPHPAARQASQASPGDADRTGNADGGVGGVGGGDGMSAAETPFVWQLVDAAGQVVMRSPNAPTLRLAERLAPGFIDAPGGWRVRGRPLADGRWLLVGQEARERLEATLEVAGGTIGGALFISLAGLAWLRRRLERETQPLADLRAVLARYDPLHAASEPLPPPALQELAPVHEAVRQMGERLAAHAAAERAFSAHAAHALRTPLAGLEAQLAVAQREAPPALQGRLARMRGATGRLSHVVAALLALFRSGGEVRRAPVDVAALVARVPFEGLAIEVPEVQARPVADADLLAAALFNLFDNAVRHGAHRVQVLVEESHITLADDGPGVSADRLAQLRQSLLRDDAGVAAQDQALAGLGLALADRVARVHGGRLELLDVQAGFCVRLWLAPESSATAVTSAAALARAPPAAAHA